MKIEIRADNHEFDGNKDLSISDENIEVPGWVHISIGKNTVATRVNIQDVFYAIEAFRKLADSKEEKSTHP